MAVYQKIDTSNLAPKTSNWWNMSKQVLDCTIASVQKTVVTEGGDTFESSRDQVKRFL